MDAIDEVLDAFRSENEHGRRNRRVLVVGVAAMLAAWIVHRETLGGVDPNAWSAFDQDQFPYTAASGALALVAPLAVYVAVRQRQSVVRYVVGAAVIPLLLLGVGALNADNRRWQLEALHVFEKYTHRFPQGRLHGLYVPLQVDRVVTVCAAEGPQRYDTRTAHSRQFCLEMIVGDDRAKKVEGGFRFNANDAGGEFGFLSHSFFDCFGDALACEGAE